MATYVKKIILELCRQYEEQGESTNIFSRNLETTLEKDCVPDHEKQTISSFTKQPSEKDSMDIYQSIWEILNWHWQPIFSDEILDHGFCPKYLMDSYGNEVDLSSQASSAQMNFNNINTLSLPKQDKDKEYPSDTRMPPAPESLEDDLDSANVIQDEEALKLGLTKCYRGHFFSVYIEKCDICGHRSMLDAKYDTDYND